MIFISKDDQNERGSSLWEEALKLKEINAETWFDSRSTVKNCRKFLMIYETLNVFFQPNTFFISISFFFGIFFDVCFEKLPTNYCLSKTRLNCQHNSKSTSSAVIFVLLIHSILSLSLTAESDYFSLKKLI